jgi:glycosyltransferase involved in cell wall biosynthesis
MLNRTLQPMKISVAMTTFNGCPFVESQLESIAAQTFRPYEIVIGDDQSSDSTMNVVDAFAHRHPDIIVRFERNSERLGTTRNFEVVVKRCVGDIVVFSDQDDLWMSTKLAQIVETFNQNPVIAYVFSNGLLIDETDQLIEGDLFNSINFTEVERVLFRSGKALDVILRHNVVTGATLAVKRDILLSVLPFQPNWLHDYYLVFVLETLIGGIIIDEPLIKYRCHSSQQVGVAGQESLKKAIFYARKQDLAYCLQDAATFRILSARLIELGILSTHPIIAKLDEKAVFCDLRVRMRANSLRAPQLIWRSWRNGYYQRYSLGWKQTVVDAMSALLALAPSSQRK